MTRLVYVALLGASGCVRPSAPAPASFSAEVATSYARFQDVRADAQRADSTVVVFPFHPDDTLAFRPRLVRPVGPVTLSPAERRLADSLVQAVERTEQLPAYRYRHQYLPAVDGRGATHVWVQGFCRVPSWWTTQATSYKGGGDCFYQVQLNLTTRRYDAFRTNAPK
ncbi:hypothetical protein I2I05_21020 [Hymenobacter sp. BT683]|uniref:Lipoprotein n=1 Tax=Hymenobacter jeongseonensis TaxID=2791027 RepID=A0ABS0ING5_9BACT|nr:hypothetical protein [Hymenobacter jeongseonensis]MBF9239887.1 hypothetical protein [Hymenobacter jeongseonensis]